MTRLQSRLREDYAAFETVQTRWNDNDQYGHIYNASYYELFDSAINMWMVERGMLQPGGPDPITVVVENGCVFFKQVSYPDAVTIGLRVGHLGTSSLVLEMGMFRGDEAEESAQARFVMVCVDDTSRKPIPFPEKQRKILAELQRA